MRDYLLLYVRFIDPGIPNGVCKCKSFKCYVGDKITVSQDLFPDLEDFVEIVIELDTGEVLRRVLDYEVL